ncbi:unnamed protein product [Owenia fusiformis]|uniref:Uncharacterized protein n=1 Tax=Owenia fusiformis TaxID=6347 RepID=A0A8J1URH2_OWEFU|nr:unnamed protein product [Owenia fusiformis]
MAVNDDNVQNELSRLRLRILQEKYEREKEIGKALPFISQSQLPTHPQHQSNQGIERLMGFDGTTRLHQAMLKRRELLDQLQMERLLEDHHRPRSYSSRRKSPPSTHRSVRSLPELSREPGRNILELPIHQQPEEAIELPSQLPFLQPLPNPPPQPQLPNQTSPGKGDAIEMLMLQNAQMHQLIMQQMMMSALQPGKPLQMMETDAHSHLNQQPSQSQPPQKLNNISVLPPIHSKRTTPQVVTSLQQPRVADPPPPPTCSPTPIIMSPRYHKSSLKKVIPYPGSRLLRKFRHASLAVLYIEILKARSRSRERRTKKLNDDLYFEIQLKEAVAAIHKIYLNPNGAVFPVLLRVLNSENVNLLVQDRGTILQSKEDKLALDTLRAIIENISFQISQIRAVHGTLGLHRKASVFSLIQPNRIFPEFYFFQAELVPLQVSGTNSLPNVSHTQAQMLILGIFLARGMVSTLLLKPVEYGLLPTLPSDNLQRNLAVVATILIYVYRRTAVPKKSKIMAESRELSQYLVNEEQMAYIYKKLKSSIQYSEDVLRDWVEEYTSRLNNA